MEDASCQAANGEQPRLEKKVIVHGWRAFPEPARGAMIMREREEGP
jgi:hypothetical protein